MDQALSIDNLDLQILKELKRDARLSYRKIAEKLHVATGTIQSRIQRLEGAGVINDYHASLNYEKLGYGITALIATCIKRKDIDRILEKIINDQNVFGAFSITGEYDVIISAKFKDIEDLNRFIIKELSDPSIEKTVTFLVLKTHKESHTFLSGD